jgi:hypothetical protein
MREMNGMKLALRIQASCPDCKVLMVSGHSKSCPCYAGQNESRTRIHIVGKADSSQGLARSLLPASEKQVIVDVQLNAGGDVVGENLVKGIGNALDRMALDSANIWRFQLATVNGKPVASEAEVIFAFSQRYPSSDS